MIVRRMGTGRLVATAVVCMVLGRLPVSPALAGQIELTPAKDATLYQYVYDGTYVAGLPDTYPKADGTSHLHVGDTNNNNGVQRGLLQFYFDPDVIPANAIVTDVSLTMTVADVPIRVLQRDIPTSGWSPWKVSRASGPRVRVTSNHRQYREMPLGSTPSTILPSMANWETRTIPFVISLPGTPVTGPPPDTSARRICWIPPRAKVPADRSTTPMPSC